MTRIKNYIFVALLCLLAYASKAQQVPDLSSGDSYLPYLSEEKKREKIIDSHVNSVKKRYPQTSEEIYTHLYKGSSPQLPKGTPDPSQVFSNYTNSVKMNAGRSQSQQPVSSNLYDLNSSILQRNQREIETDISNYEKKQQLSEKYVNEALQALYSPEINYTLGLHSGAKVEPFLKAKDELFSMLNGTQKIDFLKAVYLVESSVDPSLTWTEFNSLFNDGLQMIGALMQKQKFNASDNLAKVMSIYRFMTDTTKLYISAKEKIVTTTPMLYDFEDYEAKKDLTKVFVSKLMRTGSGQCMSLPTLFYLYAKSMKADVNLAFAPEHSYITFIDNNGIRQNIELTGRMFTTTDFYWQTGFIKSEQVKSGIYLKPLTEKEVLVHLMTTLAKAYVRKFGTDERLLEMAKISRDFAPNDLSANMLMFGYYRDLHRNILRQYEVYNLPKDELAKDQNAKAIESEMFATYNHLKKGLGYSKMPDWAYKQWLDGVNSLAQKQQHLTKKRQLENQLNK